MPQVASVVVNDGTTDVTFKPDVVNEGGLTVFIAAHSTGQLNLAQRLTISKRAIKGPEGGMRVQLRMSEPLVVTDSSTGIVSPSGTDTVSLEFTTRPGSTSASREKLLAKFAAALNDTNISAVLQDLENIWG